MFNDKEKTLEVYDRNDNFEGNDYEIINTDCDGNKTSGYYLKLGGGEWKGDVYCSKIIDLSKVENKTYLILESPIANYSMKEFVKISDNPKFFPEGFK